MPIPWIPMQPHRPGLEEILVDLLESVALEQMADAYLLNALADKIRAFIGPHLDFPGGATTEDIVAFATQTSASLASMASRQTSLADRMRIIERLEPMLTGRQAEAVKA